jgi:hypothetical protein
MIVRSIDAENDWNFGKGKNDYKSANDAIAQNIKTRLQSFLGDCFFDIAAGIDWFNLLGSKNQLALSLEINAVILNTENVTGIKQLFVSLTDRVFEVSYRVQTTYSVASDTFQYNFTNAV